MIETSEVPDGAVVADHVDPSHFAIMAWWLACGPNDVNPTPKHNVCEAHETDIKSLTGSAPTKGKTVDVQLVPSHTSPIAIA
jgi:hypothetical protein